MISIVVPVYNAEKFLAECIESVIRQTYDNWELILVNDGSTDNSEEVITRYLSDSRIRYFSKSNSGVTESRWKGVESARGEIIMFLDADDMYLSNALQFVADNMTHEIDVLTFEKQSFKESNELRMSKEDRSNDRILTDRTILADNILSGKVLSTVWGGAYRHSILSDCKSIFCNGLRIAEDTMFNLELVTGKDLKVFTTDIHIYGYRINETSVTRSVNASRFDAIRDAICYLNDYASRNKEFSVNIECAIAFRILLLWSSFMFYPDNMYYKDSNMRKSMKHLYPKAYSRLYSYLKAYIFIDLFVSSKLTQRLIRR